MNLDVKQLTLIAQKYASSRAFAPELRVHSHYDITQDYVVMCVDAVIFGLHKEVDTHFPLTAWDHVKRDWIFTRPWLRRFLESFRGVPLAPVRTAKYTAHASFTDMELPKAVRDRHTIAFSSDWSDEQWC